MAEARAMRADARRNRDAIVAAARIAFERNDRLRFDDFAKRAGVGVGDPLPALPDPGGTGRSGVPGRGGGAVRTRPHVCSAGRRGTRGISARLRGVRPRPTRRWRGRSRFWWLPTSRRRAAGELERTVADLMRRAAAEGSIRDDVPPGAVMVILHGIGSAADRASWPAEARAAVDLLIGGLSST